MVKIFAIYIKKLHLRMGSIQNTKKNDGATLRRDAYHQRFFRRCVWNLVELIPTRSLLQGNYSCNIRSDRFVFFSRIYQKKEFIIEVYYKRFSTRLKETLPKLIPFQQMTYVKNRFIDEGGRLIYNIYKMSESLDLKVCIITVNIEKHLTL